jgi:hypothetical protein
MSLLAQSAKEPRTSTVARDALSLPNQQISPARQAPDVLSQYDLMVRRVDVKPSAHEVLLAFSPA